MEKSYSLKELGWKNYFQQQITLDEWDTVTPARVTGIERSIVQFHLERGVLQLPNMPNYQPMTVGDWILIDDSERITRVLERQSLFARKAAGTNISTQLIASNIDTAFIVTSLNHDFNLNRLERYLSMCYEADVTPVLLLTKVDSCDDVDSFLNQTKQLGSLSVITVNSLENSSVDQLKEWCGIGETVVLIGSSGVGKSTIANTLLGSSVQNTQAIREDDSKGRHTTTSRSIHFIPDGGILLDTPGMRELQLTDCQTGVDETFQEIALLAQRCRFSDCQHETEPGCAVIQAIEQGELDHRRLNSYNKLMREQAQNSASLAEKRAKDKAFGKMVRTALSEKARLESN